MGRIAILGLVPILALVPIEVDGIRLEPGTTAEIRAELVPALLACGAAAEAMVEEAPITGGQAAGAIPPQATGGLAPVAHEAVAAAEPAATAPAAPVEIDTAAEEAFSTAIAEYNGLPARSTTAGKRAGKG